MQTNRFFWDFFFSSRIDKIFSPDKLKAVFLKLKSKKFFFQVELGIFFSNRIIRRILVQLREVFCNRIEKKKFQVDLREIIYFSRWAKKMFFEPDRQKYFFSNRININVKPYKFHTQRITKKRFFLSRIERIFLSQTIWEVFFFKSNWKKFFKSRIESSFNSIWIKKNSCKKKLTYIFLLGQKSANFTLTDSSQHTFYHDQ